MTDQTTTSKPLSGKTALITGATRGLGQALALTLAGEGAHIIAIGRTMGGLEDLDDEIRALGGEATLTPLDLMEGEKLDALGPTLFPRFDKLDILIGNAAYLGGLAPLSHTKTAEWEKIISTNLTANWRLIRSLHPLLERAEKSIVRFIGCDGAGEDSEAFWGPYNASKAGLEALVNAYRQEAAHNNIHVEMVTPPPMPTVLRRKAYPGEDQQHLSSTTSAAEEITAKIIKELSAA